MHPQPESYFGNVNPIGERSCYDEGKRVAETLTFDYYREHGLEVSISWKKGVDGALQNFLYPAMDQ